MQFTKDKIRLRIMKAAKKEFLEKGFEKASIRGITSKAKISKSNIYNYFKDKDDLFRSVLQPTVNKIKEGLELVKGYESSAGSNSYSMEAQKRNIDVVTSFVEENLDDVVLLLFRSQGSSLQTFKNEVTEAFTEVMSEWVQAMAPGKEIPKLFVRCVSNFYISIIEQAILHHTPIEEVKKAGEEFLKFVYHGWKGVFE